MSSYNTLSRIFTQAMRSIGQVGETEQLTDAQYEICADWFFQNLDALSELQQNIFETKEYSVSAGSASVVLGTDGVNYSCIHNHQTPTQWSVDTLYSRGDYVSPTIPNGFYYLCVDTGYSGSVEPTWPTTLNETVSESVDPMIKPVGTWSTQYADTPFTGALWRNFWYPRGTGGSPWSSGTKYVASGNVQLPADCARVVSVRHTKNTFNRTMSLIDLTSFRQIILQGWFGWPKYACVENSAVGGLLRLWPLPDTPSDLISIEYSRFIPTGIGSGDTPDIPRVYIPYLIWQLCADLTASYGLDLTQQQFFLQRADRALKNTVSKNKEVITSNIMGGAFS